MTVAIIALSVLCVLLVLIILVMLVMLGRFVREMEDKLFVALKAEGVPILKAIQDPEGDVSYVDENREAELSPAGSWMDGTE